MSIEKLKLGDMFEDIFRICNKDRPFFVKMMSHIDKGFFESKLYGKLFTIYSIFFEKFKKCPSEKIVRNELVKSGEDANVVDNIMSKIFVEGAVDSSEKDYITDLVVKHSRKQRMRDAIDRSYNIIEEDGDLTDEKFEVILNDVKDSVKFSIDTNIGIDLYEIDERYNKIASSMGEKISSGYAQIDQFIGGGFSRKELVAFQAPPGIGKCGFFDNIIEIEIDENDPLYEKIKHLIEV